MTTWDVRAFKARIISRLRTGLPFRFTEGSLEVEWAETQPNENTSLRLKVRQLREDPPRYFIITIKEEL